MRLYYVSPRCSENYEYTEDLLDVLRENFGDICLKLLTYQHYKLFADDIQRQNLKIIKNWTKELSKSPPTSHSSKSSGKVKPTN